MLLSSAIDLGAGGQQQPLPQRSASTGCWDSPNRQRHRPSASPTIFQCRTLASFQGVAQIPGCAGHRQPLSRTTRPYAQSPPTNMHSICATPSGISAWSLCAAWPIQTGAFSGVHSTKRPTQGKRPSGAFAGNHRHCLRLRRHRPHHCLCRRLVRREKKATSVCGPSPTSAAPRKARSNLARIGTAAVSTTALAACSLTSA